MDSSGHSRDVTGGHEVLRRGAGIVPGQPRRGRLRLWLVLMVLIMALVLGMLYAFNSFRAHGIANFFAHNKPPPAVVAMALAESESVPHSLAGIGTIAAVHQVTVAAQVGGLVKQILFTPGGTVKAGDPLVQLDDGPEQADLRNFEAQAHYAAVTLRRNQELRAKQAAPQTTVDQNQSQLDQANANIAKTKALIAQKLVRAPFAGRLGVRQVDVGQYVGPGMPMVSLTDLSRLYINFTLPEQDAASLKPGQEVEITVDAYRSEHFKARIATIEPQISADTRTIKVQAVMDNPGQKLLPGMFANVRVMLPPVPDAITVPETAVENTLYGDSVYVVHQDGSGKDGKPLLKAKRTPVKAGERFGGRIVILKGIKPGDRVVALGQNKVLYDGAPVTPSGSHGLALPAQPPKN